MISDFDVQRLDGQFIAFQRAAETDDELATVLRLHLLADEFLAVACDLLISPDAQRFAKNRKYFGEKLTYAAIAGMPIQLVVVLETVNDMRNKFVHIGGREILGSEIELLGGRVDKLAPISNDPARWKPMEKAFLELPARHPGKRWTFGGGDLRADFVMCFSKFWAVALPWLIKRATFASSERDSAEVPRQ